MLVRISSTVTKQPTWPSTVITSVPSPRRMHSLQYLSTLLSQPSNVIPITTALTPHPSSNPPIPHRPGLQFVKRRYPRCKLYQDLRFRRLWHPSEGEGRVESVLKRWWSARVYRGTGHVRC
ncbi:hypothetical protein BCR34DRAFT_183750 [Clohesyomyces aquaticus]|uniref:Uncharacterized protein n=1 Tax=Clohesyomyces aquaticus TaxID=1231657 RepID=A0A1Y1ZYM5_9PLEO|nr:hypothetical protein BCR34DRAFT_183750 [Clohesyomyces aquaticus]